MAFIEHYAVTTGRLVSGSVTPAKLSGRLGGIGRLTDFFPEKRVVYSPDTTPRSSVTPGWQFTDPNNQVTYDTSVFRTGRTSLKVIVASGMTSGAGTLIVLPAPVRVKGEVTFVMRSPDWTRFAEGSTSGGATLSFRLFESADGTGGDHSFVPFNLSGANVIGSYGITSTPWAADTWRAVRTIAPQYTVNNSPTGWGTTDELNYKEIRSIRIYVSNGTWADSGPATFYIDEIFADVWPAPFFGLMLDGGYNGSLTDIYTPFVARGWPGSFRVSDPGDNQVTWAQLKAAAQAGLWNIGPHLRKVTGALTEFTESHTEAEVTTGIQQFLQWMNTNLGQDSKQCGGARQASFIGNKGWYVAAEMATRLRKNGFLCARGGCSDLAGFGVNPFTTYTKFTDGGLSSLCGAMDGYIPVRGQYNYVAASGAGYAGLSCVGASPASPYTYAEAGKHDDFTLFWQGRFDVARRLNLPMMPYVHNVVARSADLGANSLPNVNDIGTLFAAAMIAYLDAHASEYVFGTISDLYSMTYGRPGSLYVTPHGLWANRDDAAWVG